MRSHHAKRYIQTQVIEETQLGDYNLIREQSKLRGIAIKDLAVLAPNNDPFCSNAPAQRRDAEWFAGLFKRFDFPAGVHLRRIHYALISSESRIQMPDGNDYLNTEKCWARLELASKYARHLGLVSPDRFADHRNPPPLIHAHYHDRDDNPRWELIGDVEDWKLPAIVPAVLSITTAKLSMPEVVVSGYGYSLLDQPYHLECWIEKSTMDDVLDPVCQRWSVNFVRGLGFQSITGVIQMLKRIAALPDDRPSRIFYISDFDPAGDSMPTQVARLTEYYIEPYAQGRDIKLTPIALTASQVEHYHLPCVPIKESDRRGDGFQDRRGVQGLTELDALEVCHPGELARLLTETIRPYRDNTLRDRMRETEQEAQESAENQWKEIVQEELEQIEELRSEIDGILHRHKTVIEVRNERLRIEQNMLTVALRAELAPYQAKLETLRERIASSVTNLDIELPDRPEAEVDPGDEAHFLYASDRDYFEQLASYKSHQNKDTIDDLEKICVVCGTPFHNRRRDTTMCSNRCRQAAFRERKRKEKESGG